MEENLKKFEIISKDFYSNCLIEAIKAKLKNWGKVKITYISPFLNGVFCPYFIWSDGTYDYDFGNEGKYNQGIRNWFFHRGHIRRRKLGYGEEYNADCKKCKERNIYYNRFM